MIKIINGIELELTAEDIIQRQIDEQLSEQQRIESKNNIEQEKANKQSAISKLKAIGLTDEEINSLLGK